MPELQPKLFMLQFTNVRKSYHGRCVLEIPGLHLERGIYWLQGANGSGKTTLLRLIAGLTPFTGDIILNEVSIKREPVTFRQQVSWAEAEPLYPLYVRGEELVAFYQSVRKASSEQVKEIISIFRVDHFLSSAIGTYSSGMVKRLSLLLAFIGHPSLILLDEPLTTLEADMVPDVLQLIRRTHLSADTAFLLSSHHNLDQQFLPITNKLVLADQKVQVL